MHKISITKDGNTIMLNFKSESEAKSFILALLDTTEGITIGVNYGG
ncbi:MAG: hypothetical protein PUK21_01385 [Peptostreptococcaceae bacterium]|nr:hypothetical protein [Peptostreptococcaceae bacterium]MDY5738661.1 hypothetical protein [Anaerovoracaceae bacterium]